MIDFNKVDFFIENIEKNSIPTGMTFNEFVMEFFVITQIIPLSKYLRSKGKTTKTPKIMNTKKAGEILTFSKNDPEIMTFLKRSGYKNIPELNYSVIMVLRKVDLFSNWKRVLSFFEGKHTVQEINDSLRKKLLPQEAIKLEEYVKEELNLSEKELNRFLTLYLKINEDKNLKRSIKRLCNN